jgi:hypothetical protein
MAARHRARVGLILRRYICQDRIRAPAGDRTASFGLAGLHHSLRRSRLAARPSRSPGSGSGGQTTTMPVPREPHQRIPNHPVLPPSILRRRHLCRSRRRSRPGSCGCRLLRSRLGLRRRWRRLGRERPALNHRYAAALAHPQDGTMYQDLGCDHFKRHSTEEAKRAPGQRIDRPWVCRRTHAPRCITCGTAGVVVAWSYRVSFVLTSIAP